MYLRVRARAIPPIPAAATTQGIAAKTQSLDAVPAANEACLASR
ncbi:Uncharacterised protein [Mycobacteroides abscessus subsp. abscessus]|nr:Uncharacterised protein [Mycobacteroides abscessus subsp. abscessus]